MSAPTSVDVHVGNRIRLIRILRGLSQSRLAESLGITFQQIQKYERGANRVGASRLYEIARVLDVPVSFFFDDLRRGSVQKAAVQSFQEEARPLRPSQSSVSVPQGNVLDDAKLLTNAETLELVNTYYNIQDSATRKQILVLLKNLAEKES
ncbi:helix-turn-helix transcriptional regulator [Acetobacteraceae bacterium ESL0709]|nr:helix-turn-helix transcriptional regulator [Acetobacteraceae bacterium ESL0697]MDF7678470.1 helix-turn-helix transcriptional regulator [Acetobacteraceae bacterium ESL0709]